MARKTLKRANYKGDWPSKTSKYTINSLQLKHVVLALKQRNNPEKWNTRV